MPTFERSLAACTIVAGLAGACHKQGLPPPPPSSLPQLVNVKTTVHGDSATIVFDPVAGAKDYRVYLAPNAADLVTGGVPAIKNATYRCAGAREAPVAPTDAEPQVGGGAIQTFVAHDVKGFTRTLADATLGLMDAQGAVLDDGDAGGVVSAVLEALQALQQHRDGVLPPDVPHDSTHARVSFC